jgi:RND family efflux transporter MFP subunit
MTALSFSLRLPLLALPLCAAPAWAADPGYTCLIEPMQRVELRSAVEGRIDAIHVERGMEVKKGQVLVELDASVERAALDAAKFRAVMQGQIKSADSRLAAAKDKFQRRDALVKERYIATQDRDDSLAEMRVAEANVVEAQDNQRLAALEQRRLGEMVEQRRLRSPITGVVTERLQAVGEVALSGDNSKPVLRLAQTDPLRVEVVLPVGMYGKVKRGDKVSVDAEAPLTGRYTANVTIVDRVVDAASGTFGVRLELANPKGEIPAGIKCRARFQ